MKHLLLTTAIVLFLIGNASAANLNQYNGTWIKSGSDSPAVTKLDIQVVDSKAHVHAWGPERPRKDYDWGWAAASSHADGHLTVRYQNNSCRHNLTINLSGNRLIVMTLTHYTDDSGRPDKDDTDTLRRLLQPVNPTPKPVGKVHPKPVSNTPTGKY